MPERSISKRPPTGTLHTLVRVTRIVDGVRIRQGASWHHIDQLDDIRRAEAAGPGWIETFKVWYFDEKGRQLHRTDETVAAS